MIKQKIIPVIICLLMVNIVTALDEFEITLIAYDSETQSAQIGVKNIDSKDYHDVSMAIDNSQPVRIVGLLRQGNAIKIPKGIPPGKHTITVSTTEGVTVKKELDFPKSQKQIKKELEIEEEVKEIKKKTVGKEETQLRVYEKRKKPIKKILIIIIALIIFILVLYFISRGKKRVT